MAAIDGKQIANMLYHAGVETLLTIGYSELGRKRLRSPAPKVDFNMVILQCFQLIYSGDGHTGYVDQAGHHPCGYYEIIYFF